MLTNTFQVVFLLLDKKRRRRTQTNYIHIGSLLLMDFIKILILTLE
jgi:hypothetical protein